VTYQPPANGFRTFLIVWATQSVSVFGSALTFFAMTIWLTQTLYPRPEQKPELALALSAVSLAFALPTVFIAPLAGAWADRHDRKRTMMAIDFVSGCLSLLVALLMLTQMLQLWMVVALAALHAFLGAFHFSAFDTSYAMLVPEKQLPRANGMMQTMWALSGILSPGIAAAIISLPTLARQGFIAGDLGAGLARWNDGAPLAITLDALTFYFAAATLIFLSIPSPKRTDLRAADGSRKSIWADVKEGALYIWHRQPLLWLLGTFTVANFVSSPIGIFMPLVVKFNLAPDWLSRGFTFETAFALLGTVGGIGGVAGGVLISAWGGLKKRRVYGVVVALIFQGLVMIVLGRSSWLYLTVAMAFCAHLMLPIMNAHSQAIWQTQTPRELQGRVFAVRRLIAQCSWPLSTALAGVIGGLFNPGAVLAVLGGILTVFCIGQLFNPYLLHVEDKAFLDEMAARKMIAVEAK
jgi:MFS transporter, DHA3 family, macrolide efflux protein